MMVWAGKLRELWECLSELCSCVCVCERRLERDISCDGRLSVLIWCYGGVGR
jgi:hypothetical protein